MDTFEEAAQSLRECGIGGITDVILFKLKRGFADLPPEVELDKTAALLSELGSGFTDYESLEWIPSDNGVYSFDMEVFDLSSMYTNFLRGVESLGGGEIVFTDIEEDDSGADWDAGTGTIEVRFRYNGSPYALKAEVMNDWFDINFAAALGKIVGKNDRRLYFTGDGYQECIVFYRDSAWAEQFMKKTGLPLAAS